MAYFAVIGKEETTSYQLVFLASMLMFIYIQWEMVPFVTSECNEAEIILLCAFPLAIIAKLLSHFTGDVFPFFVLSVLVLLPVPLMAFFVFRVVSKEMKRAESELNEFQNEEDGIAGCHCGIKSHSADEIVVDEIGGATTAHHHGDGVDEVEENQNIYIVELEEIVDTEGTVGGGDGKGTD